MFKEETKLGYANALLEIAKEEKKIKQFYFQCSLIVNILESEEKFINILDNQYLTQKEKTDIIIKTFKDFHWSLLNVIQMLSFKNQFKHFKVIMNILIKQLQEILKIKQGIIYSPNKLTASEITKLETKLSKKFHYQIVLKNLIDQELIAGFKIIIDSYIIEDSIISEIENLKSKLKSKNIERK